MRDLDTMAEPVAASATQEFDKGEAPRDLKVLVTAGEAYPAFERAVLEARDQITMGFRIFDPRTLLRSAQGKAVGRDWADLLAHALARGVKVDLYLGDFDPLMATELHRTCWNSMRVLAGVRELAGPGAAPLIVRPLLHPAAVAPIPRLVFWPLTALIRRRKSAWLRNLPEGERDLCAAETPGLRALQGLPPFSPVPLFPVSHHQKIAVIDEDRLYIGGLDLDERRWDDHDHDQPAQQTWHDVQVLIRDPEMARAGRTHLRSLPAVTSGDEQPPATPGVLRTVSRRRRRASLALSPKNVVRELSEAHHRQISKAEKLIYLETQFFRDRRIALRLAARARRAKDLKLVLLLPGAPEVVAFTKRPPLDGRFGDFLQTKYLQLVKRAFGDRMLIASPVQRRVRNNLDLDAERAALWGSPLIYLHSKVSIFDNNAAVVSSANLNGRSMKWDTETGVCLTDPEEVRKVREQIFRKWMPDDPTPEALDPDTSFEHWKQILSDNARSQPEQRRGFLVPYDIRAARATAIPVPGMPEEMV
ncbi:phospholipase D family protein [Halovulum sp. GXIMD14794]